jgi:hypothetical protein
MTKNRPSRKHVRRISEPSLQRFTQPANLMQRHPRLTFLLISALWVGLLYGGGICGPFIYDDVGQVEGNPVLSSWTKTLHCFTTGVPFARDLREGSGSFYRPLFWLSLAMDRFIWGLNPCGFHLTNVTLHWTNGFLVFLLLRRMQVSTQCAAAVSLLWLSLPVNSEAVAWISGRTYPLMCIFLLLGLLLVESYWEAGSFLALCLFAGTSAGALLSNEQGILMLPLALLLATRREQTPPVRWAGLSLAGIGVDAAYFTWRRVIEAHFPGGPPAFFTIGPAFFRYLSWALLPIRMSVERSTATPANHLSAVSVVTGFGLAGLCALAVWLRKRRPIVTVGLIWVVVALLPYCGVIRIYQGMAERYVYLASIGLVFVTVTLAWQSPQRGQSVLLSILLLWGIWGAWRLRLRVLDWADPVSLYQSSLKATPESSKLLYNLGAAFEAEGQLSGAQKYYRETLTQNSNYAPAWNGLGNIDQQTGNRARAEQEYGRAIAMDPSREDPYCNLGALFLAEGKADDALREFTKAIALNPEDPTAFYDLAVLYQKLGEDDLADRTYRKVLELKPGDPDTLDNLETLERAR